MRKVLIYGAGQTGEQVFRNMDNDCQVIGFLDGNKEKYGTHVCGVKVLGGVEALKRIEFDSIYIGSTFWKGIRDLLIETGVEEDKIIVNIPEDVGSPVRNTWLQCYAKLHTDWKCSVAEAGVYRGEFASVIHSSFPRSKLYLFDTFEGFDERDMSIELERGFSLPERNQFANTSVELVLQKIKNTENVVVCKGFFPETAEGIEDEFCFVNLDFDLYQPILSGLNFFWPKMVKQGVILVHDYYHEGLKGVRKAISEFQQYSNENIVKIPIGDNQSIALIKI